MIIQLSKQTGYILHEKASQFYGAGAGFLSIKTFFNGRAHYTSEGGHHAADDRSYLILNHGQPYTVEIESVEPVESFCIFFAPDLVQTVYQNLGESREQALDSALRDGSASLTFFDRIYPHDDLLSPTLQRLHMACMRGIAEKGWLIEQFHDLLVSLFNVHARSLVEANAVPAARLATRKEIYRRLYYAKDFADAFFTTNITIDDMARTAGLSTNHLLRMFRQVFHQSPYQYIKNRRLEHAQHLLRLTDQTVTDICIQSGFESLGAFSWEFRRRTGLSPLAYRLQNR
ncbi:MAG TPA: helix-turn-helix transcriptional regulator [Anaerolineales bacterium]|nr:helix-turn-helix transcriptional regulator [Anaerolineales bacterium]